MRASYVTAAFAFLIPLAVLAAGASPDDPDAVTEGAMRAVSAEGRTIPLPLTHTDVQAEISGFVSRVQVVQTFENPFKERIEAVYVFPLPDTGAVDSMTLRIGDRVIRGDIKKREEARRLYEEAKHQGRTAALLDQERANIFTQQVANILPGEKIHVTITYVAPLEYDHGQYTFNFPMVVGPRYIPGTPLRGAQQGSGVARDTDQVTDASRISPALLPEGVRSGHEVSLSVKLDAGVGLVDLKSTSHDVDIRRSGTSRAEVQLRAHDTVPNKDFILRYNVAGRELQAGILTHRDERGGFFTLMIQPQADFRASEITAKELFFVIDQSCSQSGLPMEKQKGIIFEALEKLNAHDTFNIVTFSSGVSFFSNRSLANTPDNVNRARAFVNALQANGGTEMLRGVTESLNAPRDPERLRMILFLSDGYVGNDDQVISGVQQHIGNARMFLYGVGSSVNHHLLRRMAEVGRGYYQYARVDEDTKKSVERFYERIARPYLVDVQLDYGDLGVKEVYPKTIGDLFASQPIIVTGRYEAGGKGRFTLKGKIAGKPYVEHIEVELPRSAHAPNAALASMFGRARIEELTRQQYGGAKPEVVEAITRTALTYKLMSAYTSFVAVDEAVRGGQGAPVTVSQPVELPEGTERQGFVGGGRGSTAMGVPNGGPMPSAPPAVRAEPRRKLERRYDAKTDASAEAAEDGDVGLGGFFGTGKGGGGGEAVTSTRPQKEVDTRAALLRFDLRAVMVRGALSKAQAQVALRRVLAQASRELGSGVAASGSFTLAITFSADGKVKDVKVVHDGVGVKAVTDALKRHVATASVGALTSETVVTATISVR